MNDTVYVDYTPVMDETNKTFVVRQLNGVEEIIIDQTGSGYDSEIPPPLLLMVVVENLQNLRANVSSTGFYFNC